MSYQSQILLRYRQRRAQHFCCNHSSAEPALLVTNAKPKGKRHSKILKKDPTRTTLVRNNFMKEMRMRFARLKKAVRTLLVDRNALRLKKPQHPVTMAEDDFEFTTDADKLTAFLDWFKQQVADDVLSATQAGGWQAPAGSMATGPWTTRYVESAYKKGLVNAYLAAKQADIASQTLDFSSMTQDEFLREAFSSPELMSKIQLLGTRAFENLKGITDTMASQMNMILAQGMADGDGPDSIASDMTDSIDGLTDTRALTLARTETINAHAEGQLDSFDALGVDQLGVEAEWSTAGDDRVCPECEEMEGKTFTVDEARGMIPLHPNCRCSWIPAEKKEDA